MMNAAHLIAIDPGAISGAYALFANGKDTQVGDLSVVDRQVDAAAFARMIEQAKPAVAVVERVAAMPAQGVASTFRFGVAVGIIQGVLAAHNVPFHLVTPGVWKKSLGLLSTDKEASRALAIRLYPSVRGLERKKDQGRAEALLIGHWFRHHRGDPTRNLKPFKMEEA
jgi:Holliday junction resolvasome RuvABC endonuclease subunit